MLQAASGETALSVLQESCPDLIISDVMMPGMDGFALYEQVRANPEWSQIPFIFVTARGQRTDVRHGMGLGADDYLTKPFEAEELLAAVRVRLSRATETRAAINKASADLRDTIIRALSHEFRTPLALIVGYTELLEESAQETSDEEFYEFLQGLRMGSERLTNLVEDFLLLSRLESGTLVKENHALPERMVEPDQVLSHVVEQFEDQASARNISLTVNARAPGATVALSERFSIEIVRRLVDNAIKFSKKEGGRVILTTRQAGGFWILDVVDDGIGIRQDALAWVFEAFRQVDRAKMEQQGAGLGLAIVRGLAELCGGCVEVQSKLGSGSKFTIWLPLAD